MLPSSGGLPTIATTTPPGALVSRPLVFGYVVERAEGPPPPTVHIPTSLPTTPAARSTSLGLFFDETAISRFASREGFELAHIFRDRAADAVGEPRRSGFQAMIDAARRRDDLAAVVIVAANHLGPDGASQAARRRRVECDAGLPVLTVRLAE